MIKICVVAIKPDVKLMHAKVLKQNCSLILIASEIFLEGDLIQSLGVRASRPSVVLFAVQIGNLFIEEKQGIIK